MSNHPNRGARVPNPGESPTPAMLYDRRIRAGLTVAQAIAMVYCGKRTWETWESGINDMPPASWELFWNKTRAACKRSLSTTIVSRETAQKLP